MMKRKILGVVVCTLAMTIAPRIASAMTPPTLQANASSTTSARLSWVDLNEKSFGYEIERSRTATTGFMLIASVGKTIRTYADNGLSAAAIYYYRVRVNGPRGTYSPYSNVAGVSTIGPTATAVPNPTTTAPLTAAPTRTTTPTTTATTTPLPTRTTTATVTAVATTTSVPTRTATATVTATTTPASTRTTTATVTATTTPIPTRTATPVSTQTPVPTSTPTASSTPVQPAPPTNLVASATMCTQSTLTWSAAPETGGLRIASYDVYRKRGTDSGFTFVKRVAAPTTATADTALGAVTMYQYNVYAIDESGNASSASNTASTTTPACQPPVANAGPDQTVAAPTAVTVDGSASWDPDGTIISYSWAFGDGASSSGMTASHTYAAPGTYTARLTVSDNQGMQSSDTATITIAGATIAPTGAYLGASRFGGTGLDWGLATAVDKRINCDGTNGSNCVVMAGRTVGTIDLGGGPRSAVGGGGDDLFVAKYTAAGAHLWSRVVGGTSTDRATGVAVDSNGDVIVVGYSRATADLGGGARTGLGGADIVIAKYSGASGAHLWSTRVGGTGQDFAEGIAVDASGSIVVVGSFEASVDFGNAMPLSAGWGITDMFVAKYSPAGACLWAKNFYSTSVDVAKAVAVDAAGNIAITGYFTSILDMGGGSMTTGLSEYSDVFVAKLSATGAHLWSRRFGGAALDAGNGVAMDRSGNVVATGIFTGAADFGTGTLPTSGGNEVFVAKYASATGAAMWSSAHGGTGIDTATGVVSDGADDVVVTGFFNATASFGGPSMASAGSDDIFVAKYAGATGAHRWSRSYGGILSDRGSSVAVDAANNVLVTGSFSDVVDFGGGPLTSPAGNMDAFLLKLAP
jgi:PKD repeat protein